MHPGDTRLVWVAKTRTECILGCKFIHVLIPAVELAGRVDAAAAARLVAELDRRPEAGDPQQRRRAAGAALQERDAQRTAAAQVNAEKSRCLRHDKPLSGAA